MKRRRHSKKNDPLAGLVACIGALFLFKALFSLLRFLRLTYDVWKLADYLANTLMPVVLVDYCIFVIIGNLILYGGLRMMKKI